MQSYRSGILPFGILPNFNLKALPRHLPAMAEAFYIYVSHGLTKPWLKENLGAEGLKEKVKWLSPCQ
jgi:hypothetical protein